MRIPDNAEQARTAPLRALRAIFAGVGQLLLAADKFRSENEDLDTEDQYDPFRTWDNPVAEAEPEVAVDGEDHPAGSKKAGKDGDETMRIRKNRSREAEPPRKFRSLDLTGNVRVLTPAELAELAREDAAGDDTAADDTAEDDVWPAAAPGPVTPGPVTPNPGAPGLAIVEEATDGGLQQEANGLGTQVSVWGSTTSIWDAAEPSPWTAQVPELPIAGYDGLSIASLRARLRTMDVTQLQVLLDHERSGARRDEFVTMLERRIGKLTATADDAS